MIHTESWYREAENLEQQLSRLIRRYDSGDDDARDEVLTFVRKMPPRSYLGEVEETFKDEFFGCGVGVRDVGSPGTDPMIDYSYQEVQKRSFHVDSLGVDESLEVVVEGHYDLTLEFTAGEELLEATPSGRFDDEERPGDGYEVPRTPEDFQELLLPDAKAQYPYLVDDLQVLDFQEAGETDRFEAEDYDMWYPKEQTLDIRITWSNRVPVEELFRS